MVLCVSENTARRVREAISVPVERIPAVLNAVRDAFVPGDRAVARHRLGLIDETVLLTVSHLDARQRHKGHDRVIPLLPVLAQRQSGVVYLIAGDGDDRGRLLALAELHGVTRDVLFLGRVPDEQLPDLCSAADVYVMPSNGEGFGIAFVEAMCCGTPAIGLAIDRAPDALCHGELGTAVASDEFPDALLKLVIGPRNDPIALAASPRSRFGREAFPDRHVHGFPFSQRAAIKCRHRQDQLKLTCRIRENLS